MLLHLLIDHLVRLFSGIQAGTAVGEPIARLRELGIVSSKTGQQISDLLKQGMKGDQVWALAERELRKVTGTMEAMSKTTKGLWSTFKDKLNLVMANFGRVLLPLVRAVLIKLNEILDKVILSTKNLADEIGSTAKIGIGFVKMLDFMRIALVNLFAGGEINKNFMAFEKGLLTAFGSVAFFFKKLSEAKGTIKNDFKDIGNIIFIMFKTIGEHILGFWGNIFVSIFKKVKNFFHTVHKANEAVFTLSISELGKDDFNKFFKRLNQIELKSKSIDKRIAQSFKNNIGKTLNDRFEKNIQEYIKATEKQRGKLGEAFGELLLGDPQQRKDFINKFIMDVTQEFAKMEKGMELDLTVDDKGGMLDKISKVAKTLKPTLAVRGSQEAFRIGQDSDLMKKQLKANEQQVKQQKITNDLLNNIGNMIGNVTKFGRAKPFNPNIQAGAGAGGVT